MNSTSGFFSIKDLYRAQHRRIRNPQFYDLLSEGSSPLTLADVKNYLKVPVINTVDDDLINLMISAATQWGEKYTGREFRVNSWALLIDFFDCPIRVRRNPISVITSIERMVDGNFVVIPVEVYYEKKLTQFSEILLADGQDWPNDTDEREQAIKVTFDTEIYRCKDLIEQGLLRHVAYWYRNRGDCADCAEAAILSGVSGIYDSFTIARV